MLLYQILAFTVHKKNIKVIKTSLKHQLQLGMTNLNYLTDHIL